MSKEPPVDCLILGGGGHASVVLDCLLEAHTGLSFGILDSDPALKDHRVLGVPVLGSDELLPHQRSTPHRDMRIFGEGWSRDSIVTRLYHKRQGGPGK